MEWMEHIVKTNNNHTDCASHGKRWLLALISTVLMLSFTEIAHAQLKAVGKDTSANSRHGFAGAPYVKYAPETGFVGGLVGLYYFHIGDASGQHTRPSDLSSGVMYSQKHQYSIGVNYDLYTPGDDYHLNGGLHYQRIPLDFFGVGNYGPRDPIDNYTPIRRGTEFTFTKNVIRSEQGEGLNVGVEGEFRNDAVLNSDSSGMIAMGNVPGSNGGFSSGAGVIALYDTRDNKYSTQDGQYNDIEAIYYGRTLWSDFTFSRYTVDLRRFYPVAENQTIAAQFYGVLANGNEPFYMLSGLGGDSKLRGYYLSRFRDNDLALLQTEYRFPIVWRFGGVVFAGAGEVGHQVSDFTLAGLHPSVGVGLRLLVGPAEHLNARVDYGIGSDSKQIYFSILEAF